MVTRPLNVEECNALRPGHVYAWDDRCSQSESTGSGTERFADGRHWGASRQRDGFLFYFEKWIAPPDSDATEPGDWSQHRLVKQVYPVWVESELRGRRKWFLTAYLTMQTVGQLGTVDDDPQIEDLAENHRFEVAFSGAIASRSSAALPPSWQAQLENPAFESVED
ncbi:hypothetical protein CVT26_014101 [Gymnopilus dilepis]|uniref:Uncharacterized protein n=1 Tax=Gymnopilus dilepis TaxID=231916 RepID=A0A409Y823_9AGAR|nr:hypothetical protein CVT26_014101 [Gymnopilus dilepis]